MKDFLQLTAFGRILGESKKGGKFRRRQLQLIFLQFPGQIFLPEFPKPGCPFEFLDGPNCALA